MFLLEALPILQLWVATEFWNKKISIQEFNLKSDVKFNVMNNLYTLNAEKNDFHTSNKIILTSKKSFGRLLLLFFSMAFISTQVKAQNSMTGDGFGGRLWYVAHNYQVGSYTAYTVCNNQLYAWGDNHLGQFGDGDTTSTKAPVAVTGMSNIKFYSSGYLNTAIKTDGTAWIWGLGTTAGGTLPGSGFTKTPQQILTDVKFSDGGMNHAVFVKNDGTVWGVGSNYAGELGNGTTSTTPITTPVQMTGITNAVRAVSGGVYFSDVDQSSPVSIILLADGTVKMTGGGITNPLSATGYFKATNSTTPVTLAGLSHIVDIKASTYIGYALDSSGNVYSWGRELTSTAGLGLGTGITTQYTPTKITFPAGAAPIIALSANSDGYLALALDANGNVYGWGGNFKGQLGIGTNATQYSPILVATGAIDIFAGETFNYILKNDNTLWAAGADVTGTTGSIWMNLPPMKRLSFTQIDPTIAPMNLCVPVPMNGCNAGTTAPVITPTTASNICPATTVNLTTLASTGTTPTSATKIWSLHNRPTAVGDTLTTAQASAVGVAGKYYTFFYDAAFNCYSPADSVVVTINSCVVIAIKPTYETGSVLSTGGIALSNIAANDSINGLLATLGASGNAVISQIGVWQSGISLDQSTGIVSVASGTPIGTYPIVYQLCDKTTPTANCKTVTDTVIVTPVINPITETGSVPSTGGIALSNIAANDSINGLRATLGASGNAVVSQIGVWQSGISLDQSTGIVSVASGTPIGTYPIVYQLCDKTTPTANCKTVTDTVVVTPVINPITETGSVSSTGGIALSNIAANDSINGLRATLGASGNAVISQIGVWQSGISLDPITGIVSVASGTPIGTYPIVYQLCDKSTPTANCKTVTDTVIVTSVINPITETGSVPSTGGIALSNIAANDSINGLRATLGASGNGVISQIGVWQSGISLDPSTGIVSVASGTPIGTYPIVYQLCDKTTPTANCKTAMDTVIVTPVINPITEKGSIPSTGGIALSNIAANDSINGLPATLGASGNAVISQIGAWQSGITLDPSTGIVSVASGTPIGTYPIVYQLCDKTTPTANCKTVTDTVIVTPVINPITETGSVPSTGGIALSNIAANDSINGLPATLGASGNAVISQIGVWQSGISLDPSIGIVSVAGGTPIGTYPIVYQLCDKTTPTANCKTVTDTVIVTPVINPITETGSVPSTGGIALSNIAANDSINGLPATLGTSGNAVISQMGVWQSGISLDPSTGIVSVAGGTPIGTYPIVYQLCDKTTPTANCKTVTDTVVVTPVINPITETGSVPSTGGIALSNIAANDSINGLRATLGASGNAVISQMGVWQSGISLDPSTGIVSVASGTPIGTYPIVYQLCDKTTPTANCKTVTDTVVVTPVINPITETGSVPSTGGIALSNIAANDSINGLRATLGASGNAVISQIGVWQSGINLDPSTGIVSVASGTLIGTYPIVYQLCDKTTPTANCKTVTDTVIVTPVINPITEKGSVSSTGGIALSNIAANDSINGLPATLGASGNSVISQMGVWQSGISLDPSTGIVSVASGTPIGTYPIVYQLCDKTTPTANCKTITDTVVVTPVINPITETGSIPSTGGIALSNIVTNDSINGLRATLGASGNGVISQIGVWQSGISLDPSTGIVSVAGGTPIGTYPIVYQLCDKTTPTANCKTVTDTVVVTPVINPITETGSIPSTGGIALINIAANDSINGLPATLGASGNGIVSQIGVWQSGINLDPSTGIVSVAGGTPIGTYPIVYQLCDKTTPTANCKTVTDTVIVTPVINPITETGSVPSTGGIALSNIAANDSINGLPATLGASGNAVISQIGVWQSGISLNATTGTISVASGTPIGTYPIVYQLCDKTTPTANCKTVTDTVVVTPVINPITETGSVPSTGGIALSNIAANDSINGLRATLGASGNAVISQIGVWQSGISLNATTGTISVASGTPIGTYPIVYQLCDKTTPTANCKTVTDTVIVTPVINPITETGSVPSTGGIALSNIVANDSINGLPATLGASGNAVISQIGVWQSGISLDPSTGIVSVASGTPIGTYPIEYQLCDKTTPTANCKTVTDTVVVTPVINPITEKGSVPSTGGIALSNIAANDSINGLPATFGASGNGVISQIGVWQSGISLDPSTGIVSVASGTPIGTYPIVYQLCDKTMPTANCKTITDTVIVTPVINPITEKGSVPSTGGIALSNIAANDSINGLRATLGASGNAVISQIGVWQSGISLDPSTGIVSVASGTPIGTYPIVYQLCDKTTPTANCKTVTDTVIVTPVINPITETGSIPSTGGIALSNIAANDSINGLRATLGASGNAVISQIGVWQSGISLDPSTGIVSVASGTPIGTYPIVYQLCDKTTPTANCKTVTDTVIVTPVINPITETGSIPSTGGIALSNIAANDSINGLRATLGASGNGVINQIGVWQSGISLDPSTGIVSVASGTPIGTYPIVYQLCDKTTPTANCKTVTDTVVVTPVINPITETGSVPSTGGIALSNIAANDSINGLPATLGASGNGVISQIGVWQSGISLDPSTGIASVASGTPIGTYPIVYQLCDKTTPTANCKTVTDTVIVTPVINPITEKGSVPSTGGIALSNIAANDSINGLLATLGASGNAVISQIGVWQSGISLDPSTGIVSVASGTPIGTYPIVYQLCDKTTPTANCKTVTDTVIVTPVINPITETGSVPSTGGIALSNIAVNDSINGLLATLGASGNAVISQIGVWQSGISLDPITGIVSVASGTPIGTYPIVYQLCDKTTPTANCKTVTDTVVVTPVINPITETGSVPSTGGIALSNIAANDSINGLRATLGASGNAVISQIGVWQSGISLDPSTGIVSVAGGTPIGIYPIVYQLCDKTTPTANCKTVTDTVIVTPVINPITETGSVPSTGGIAFSNIAANDSINGLRATLGASGNGVISEVGTWQSGISLDPSTGIVSVAGGTPIGTYPIVYQLCDKTTPTTNCKTVTDTVIVTPVINPITEKGSVLSTGGIALSNIVANDSINGLRATLGASGNGVISQIGVWQSGISLDPLTGNVVVSPGVHAGIYPIVYQICDKTLPVANCNTMTDTVFVTNMPPVVPDSIVENVFKDSTITTCFVATNVGLNDVLSATITCGSGHGMATTSVNGNQVCVTYTPTSGFIGIDSICVQVCNIGGLCDTVKIKYNVTPLCANINLKVLLEGPLSTTTGLMQTTLNQRGLLPGQTPIGQFAIATPAGQPYNVAPWNYGGTESVTTYPSTVVDWVLVSFRSAPEVATTLFRYAGLLHEDGTVTFPNACISLPDGAYYVLIEHRNHVGVMSPNPVQVVNSVMNFDFTTGDSYILTNPPTFGQKQKGGKWVMFAADGKKNTTTTNYDINFSDSQLWKLESGIFDQYRYGDFNLDADVNFIDSQMWKANNGQYSGVPH